MLAHYINKVFAMEEEAAKMGRAAAMHARKTHDAKTNLETLIRIYEEIAK